MYNFWFSGLWASPLGLILAIAYANLAKLYRGGLFNPSGGKLETIDYVIMMFIVIGVVLLVFLINLKRKLIDGIEDFNPFHMRNNIENSVDKRKAQYHPVPSTYLSKIPDGFTVGKKGNRYVRIPFLDSPEHQLILGSPGSNKSTSILNALLWNYNFSDKNKSLRAVIAVDAKPELSKKSVFEGRKDIKIINPTSYNSWGFDVWYGLNQSSSDDELKERAEMIARSLITSLSGDNAHFSGNAQKILSGLLMYGFRKGLSFTDSIIQVMHVSVEDLIAQIIEDP